MSHSAFIVFEGGEGSGKSTMSKRLVEHLKNSGTPCIWTREPGGSEYAEKIRELILSPDAAHADAETLFGLFIAARRDHITQTVLPALAQGKQVICDRFMSSTWAYQIVAQNQPQLREIFWSIHTLYLGDLSPQYVWLDVPPEIGLMRAKSRSEATTHLDDRDIAFHSRVREGFKEFFSFIPSEHITVVDATQGPEDVFTQVLHTFEKLTS